MPKPEGTDKFQRCKQACIAVLQEAWPRYLGSRQVSIILANPQLGETHCDEIVRRALNKLVDEKEIVTRKTGGIIKIKVFACEPPKEQPQTSVLSN